MTTFIKRIDEWFDSTGHELSLPHVPGGPWLPVTIAVIYLIAAVWIGPKLMRGREPFKLNLLIRIYNLINIIVNAIWFLAAMFFTRGLVDCWFCRPFYFANHHNTLIGVSLSYMYLKIFDLFDTVFFVLRKKDRQVS